VLEQYTSLADKIIKEVFLEARNNIPTAIVIEDIDLIMDIDVCDENILQLRNELLSQLDTICKAGENILIVGICSSPWNIDKIILKKFQKFIFASPPTDEEREAFIRKQLEYCSHVLSDSEIQIIVKKTEKYICNYV
jgi:SpoVK/Ycf46/Vps4 family AAA+-type ATPase